MTTLALLFACAALAVLVIGLRGKIVSRDLDCAKCGYSLSCMQRTPRSVCPECGHEVWTGAAFHNRRQPSRPMLLASAVCMFLAGVCAFPSLLGRLDIDWRPWRSARGLIAEIETAAAAPTREKNWTELLRRWRENELDPAAIDQANAAALQQHLKCLAAHDLSTVFTDPSVLDRTLGDEPDRGALAWLRSASDGGALADAAVRAHVERLFKPRARVQVEPSLPASGALAYRIELIGAGRGGFEAAQVAVRLESLSVDGRPVELRPEAARVHLLTLERSGWHDSLPWLSLPIDLPAGSHELRLTVKIGVTHMEIGSGSNAIEFGMPATDHQQWPTTLVETAEQITMEVQVRSDTP